MYAPGNARHRRRASGAVAPGVASPHPTGRARARVCRQEIDATT